MVKILDRSADSIIAKFPIGLESHLKALSKYEKLSNVEMASIKRAIAYNKKFKNMTLAEIL